MSSDFVKFTHRDRSAFQAFYAEPGQHDAPVFFVCDHASNACPPDMPDMGIGNNLIQDHIGWDIGAAGVTSRLASHYDAGAVYSGFTRLYIDPNRGQDDPTMIPPTSDGVRIPYNQNVDADEREYRLNNFLRPYHEAVSAELDAVLRGGTVPLIVAIHSFTPSMDGFDRPWHLGVLWARDPRIKGPALDYLAGLENVVSGENEPYSAITGPGYTLDAHCLARGLPHLLLEIRQDLIGSEEGQDYWAGVTRGLIDHLIAQPDIMKICRY